MIIRSRGGGRGGLGRQRQPPVFTIEAQHARSPIGIDAGHPRVHRRTVADVCARLLSWGRGARALKEAHKY